MKTMKTPEQVKKGLEHCMEARDCIKCPYDGRDFPRCIMRMSRDAIDSIQQLEAKLAEYEKPLVPLALDEVTAISREEGNILWLEYRDEAAVRAGYNGYYEPQHIMEYSAFSGYKSVVTFYPPGAETEKTPDPAVYGIGWRCWSCKPTDEERKAAKWDE